MTSAAQELTPTPSTGARLVAADGERGLPLRETRLRAEAHAGLARVILEQRFSNPWNEPLTVTYSLPLPHDAAVSGFAFRIGERRIVGEVDRLDDARERFEEALLSGHSAALVEQERGSLFTQQVGNIAPGEELIAEVTVDQPLAWLDGEGWEWRFPLVAAPRYLGAAGTVDDAERVTQDVALSANDGPSLSFNIAVHDHLADEGVPRTG